MSFVLNKMASMLATLVVVGLVLFCSSAAQAHVSHDPAAPGISAQVAAGLEEVQAASDKAGDKGAAAAAKGDDKPGGHRSPGSSCCGTGLGNCMAAATVGSAGCQVQVPPAIVHAPVGPATSLLGAVVDGLIRPPRILA